MLKRFGNDSVMERLMPRIAAYAMTFKTWTELRAAGSACLTYMGVLSEANLGDQILLSQSGQHFPSYHIINWPGNLNWISRRVSKATLNSCSGYIIGGGTLLLGGKYYDTLDSAIQRGLQFLTYGSGVQDPDYWDFSNQHIERWVATLNQASLLGCRGPESLRILKGYGLNKAEMVGDPAFCYSIPEHVVPEGIDRKCIGISVGYSSKVIGEGFDVMYDGYRKILMALAKDGWKFRFFCVWPRDLKTIESLIDDTGIQPEAIIKEYYSAERFKQEVRQCAMMIGMKLHADILATCAAVPTIAVNYQPKLIDYMASINSLDYLVNIDQKITDNVIERVKQIAKDPMLVSVKQWEAGHALATKFQDYIHRAQQLTATWRRSI